MSNPGNRQSNSSTASMFDGQQVSTRPQRKGDLQPWNAGLYNSIKEEIGLVVALAKEHSPKGLSDTEIGKRFYAKLLMYCSDKPYLWECDPKSVQKSAILAMEEGLDINTPNEAHLVPYSGKATLQRGYKGVLKMARRDPSIDFIKAMPVYRNDFFSHEEGSVTRLEHKIDWDKPRGDIRLFYAVAATKSGGTYIEVMSAQDIIEHAKRFTKATSKGPFAKLTELGAAHPNFEAYGRKTVLLRLINRQLDIHSSYTRGIEQENEHEVEKEFAAIAIAPIEEAEEDDRRESV